MRAVADNQQVAMAMGINVERYFALAWAMAGIVSALGGVIWGSMLGVDVHLALVGLKVFPVVILGGLDSVLGAIVGGLIVGVVESLAAGDLDPYVGGGTKDFAPYVLMIIALMFKPYGIFGTHRVADEVERSVLLARERVPDLHAASATRRDTSTNSPLEGHDEAPAPVGASPHLLR